MLPELKASDILFHPQKIKEIQGKYVVIAHEGTSMETFRTLDDALTLMVGLGWRQIDVAVTRSESVILAFILMEKV